MTTRRSGHTPRQRLVHRPTTGPHDGVLWDHLQPVEPEVPDEVRPPADQTIDERFAAWIDRNPQVLTAFVRLARQARDAGRERVGAKMIAEVLRWESYIEGDDGGYKLNNVYVSRLVRLAVAEHPDLEGLFEMRRLQDANR